MKSLFVILSIILCSCESSYPIHCKIADRVTSDFRSKLEKNDGLVACMYGGAMLGDIQKINLGFNTEQCLNIPQMRMLIVQKAEELVADINSDLEIRPYLRDFPATVKNIELSISYYRKGKNNVTYPHVVNAQISRGKILYMTIEDEVDNQIIDSHEDYYNALQAIQENKFDELSPIFERKYPNKYY